MLTRSGRIALGTKGNSTISTAPAVAFTKSKKTSIGSYYLDGHTITVKLDNGEVFHKYIGILNKKNGRVTALFLGNKFYSEGLAGR